MKYYESCQLNAKRMRNLLNNNIEFPDNKNIVFDILKKKKTTLKLEEIVKDFAMSQNTTDELARELVSASLIKLEKDKKVTHVDHGYWKLSN